MLCCSLAGKEARDPSQSPSQILIRSEEWSDSKHPHQRCQRPTTVRRITHFSLRAEIGPRLVSGLGKNWLTSRLKDHENTTEPRLCPSARSALQGGRKVLPCCLGNLDSTQSHALVTYMYLCIWCPAYWSAPMPLSSASPSASLIWSGNWCLLH